MQLRKELEAHGADVHILNHREDIAWLFNYRALQFQYVPTVKAYAIVSQGEAYLFIAGDSITTEVRAALEPEVQIHPYSDFSLHLKQLANSENTILLAPEPTNSWTFLELGNKVEIILKDSPVTQMKARKNAVEIAGMQNAHTKDGVAMVRFLHWFFANVATSKLTEIDIDAKLISYRSEQEDFMGLSFASIVGYREHGAIIHYRATEKTNSVIGSEGILLIDSGGQYRDGTTDITRTILVGGTPSAAQKEHYTRVLKGFIAINMLKFPEFTTGQQVDTLARSSLWEIGLDYEHGTGHGVGCYLNVHENPVRIAKTSIYPLRSGNIISNEPGYYKEGEYGIRIENLALIKEHKEIQGENRNFLEVSQLTLCPIETKLIDPTLLTIAEKTWLNDYHHMVYTKLHNRLNANEATWLKRVTAPI